MLIKSNSDIGDKWYMSEIPGYVENIRKDVQVRIYDDNPYYTGYVGRIQQIRRLRYLVKTGQKTIWQAIRMFLK